MAGYYRYTAVLDACVLYPASLRDLLLTLSVDGVNGARWTDDIRTEMQGVCLYARIRTRWVQSPPAAPVI